MGGVTPSTSQWPVLICLSAGTTHKPSPRDARGFDSKEAAVGAVYVLKVGVRCQFWIRCGCAVYVLNVLGLVVHTREVLCDD